MLSPDPAHAGPTSLEVDLSSCRRQCPRQGARNVFWRCSMRRFRTFRDSAAGTRRRQRYASSAAPRRTTCGRFTAFAGSSKVLGTDAKRAAAGRRGSRHHGDAARGASDARMHGDASDRSLERDGRALAMVGDDWESAITLAAHLHGRGWSYIGSDNALLDAVTRASLLRAKITVRQFVFGVAVALDNTAAPSRRRRGTSHRKAFRFTQSIPASARHRPNVGSVNPRSAGVVVVDGAMADASHRSNPPTPRNRQREERFARLGTRLGDASSVVEICVAEFRRDVRSRRTLVWVAPPYSARTCRDRDRQFGGRRRKRRRRCTRKRPRPWQDRGLRVTAFAAAGEASPASLERLPRTCGSCPPVKATHWPRRTASARRIARPVEPSGVRADARSLLATLDPQPHGGTRARLDEGAYFERHCAAIVRARFPDRSDAARVFQRLPDRLSCTCIGDRKVCDLEADVAVVHHGTNCDSRN